MGTLKIHDREQVISGKIDRLLITQESILFADFKTGVSPKDEKDIAPHYFLQMALYQKLLQSIYPKKDTQGLLIYTEEAKIFTLTSQKLDEFFNKITL